MAKKRGNQEGSVYQLKDGRWVAECMIGWKTVVDPETGEPKQKRHIWKVYGKTRKEVVAQLTDMMKARNDGTFVEPSKKTLGDWLDEWLTTFKQRKLAGTTLDSYRHTLQKYIVPALGHVPLKDLTTVQLQRLYNEKEDSGLSGRTVRYIHQVIHGGLEQARKLRYVSANVSQDCELPDLNTKPQKALSQQEEAAFLTALEKAPRWQPAFVFLLESGMRRGELLALHWNDIDMQNKQICVRQGLTRTKSAGLAFNTPKTPASIREIPLTPKLESALKTQRSHQAQDKLFAGGTYQDNGLIFASERGTPLEPRNLGRAYTRTLKAAGIQATLHQLRHTFASRLIEAGADVKTVAELMGHAKPSMTLNRYTHISMERKRQAMAIKE